MTASELWELDKAVTEVLGFGDLWFPPDCPTSGPDWSMGIHTVPDLFR